MVKTKGHEFLIKSLFKNSFYHNDLQLHIAGEGPERRSLQLIIDELGLHKKVFLHGYISDIPQFLKDKEIYIQSSISESFGIAILEAMAAGLCVIATNVGGIPDIVEHGKNGILFHYGDEKGLRGQLQRVIEDADLRLQFSLNGTDKVTRMFSISETVRIYQQAYKGLLVS